MKQVGNRLQASLSAIPSASSLDEGFALSATVSLFAGGRTFIPKGVYRYKSHEDANRHEAECIAKGMASLAIERKKVAQHE